MAFFGVGVHEDFDPQVCDGRMGFLIEWADDVENIGGNSSLRRAFYAEEVGEAARKLLDHLMMVVLGVRRVGKP